MTFSSVPFSLPFTSEILFHDHQHYYWEKDMAGSRTLGVDGRIECTKISSRSCESLALSIFFHISPPLIEAADQRY